MKGFMLHDYVDQFGEAQTRLTQWYREGKILNLEQMIEGIENAPQAFIDLFKGANIGKQIVKLSR